jgi:hypothetical protein
MPSIEDVKKQIKNLDGLESFLAHKEIKELPKILWEDEAIVNLVQGFYNNGTGLLVATNKRLIFVDKGMLWGVKVEDFPYDKISSIQYETGIFMGEIDIFASGNKAEIKNITKAKVRPFAESIRARISGAPSSNQKTEGEDKYSKLEKLAELKEKGILSEKEFEEEKKKLLG